MATFSVFDNGKPAIRGTDDWAENSFTSLSEALDYAHAWLGDYSPGKTVLWRVAVNMLYDYSGYGDTIEIRTEDAK